MKKYYLALICLFVFNEMPIHASRVPIGLVPSKYDDTPVNIGRGKAPRRMPVIYQDGYTLSLSSYHPEYIINIIQDDVVVYSSLIPEGVTEYDLPSYLEGEYLIQFVSESNCFTGYIVF